MIYYEKMNDPFALGIQHMFCIDPATKNKHQRGSERRSVTEEKLMLQPWFYPPQD